MTSTYHTNQETDAGKDGFQTLHHTLDKLDDRYSDFLKQESVLQQVNILKHTIDDCLNGSHEAQEYLIEHGCDILADIKTKLDGALQEQTRLLDEATQISENFTGGKADRASKAVATVSKAKEELEQVIESINS